MTIAVCDNLEADILAVEVNVTEEAVVFIAVGLSRVGFDGNLLAGEGGLEVIGGFLAEALDGGAFVDSLSRINTNKTDWRRCTIIVNANGATVGDGENRVKISDLGLVF